jgi:integrase
VGRAGEASTPADVRQTFAASAEGPVRGIDWDVAERFGRIRRRQDGRLYIDFGRAGRLYTAHGSPFETPDRARMVLDAVRTRVAQGVPKRAAVEAWLPAASAPNRVGRWLGVWLDRMRELEAAGDRTRSYVEELERWARPEGHFSFWDGRSVHELHGGDVEEWSAWLSRRGLAAKTRLNVMAGFHSFLEWLHRSEVIARVPPFAWPRVQEHVPTILAPQTQEAVLRAIPEAKRGIFLAMALLGVRPSEAIRLNAADLVDGWVSVRLTKNRQAKRVPVPAELGEWVAAHVPHDARFRGLPLFALPYAGRGRRGNGRWNGTSLRREWHIACASVGVRVKLYEGTKHSGATALLALGVSERTLQTLLGHQDARSTRRYARLGDAALVEALGRRRGSDVVPAQIDPRNYSTLR